jgi:hypothetical protein
MGDAMTLAGIWLRLRLWLRRASSATHAALLLCAVGFGALAWLVPARQQLEAEREAARRAAALPPPSVAVAVAPSSAGESLARFQAALGSQRDVEPGVKTLFRLAAKSGLVLRQGEYKRGYDRNARLHTYQVNLPVKGSYAQVWQFAFLALRAIPFAALDDVSFKRDAIGETAVEGRLRLTFYLHDAPGAPR